MKMFSIIIPCYNAFKLMSKNLNNLENQTSKDFEVIIVDDCSTDNSYQELLDYSKKSKMDIKIIKNERNLGPGETRNNGIRKAEGEYIFFIDSDDYIEIDTIEELSNIVKKEKADCIFFDYYIDKAKMVTKRNVLDNINEDFCKSDALIYSSGTTLGKVYKLKNIKENNIKFLDLKRNEDMPFNKVAIAYSNSFFYLRKNLYHYVMNNNSLMHRNELLDENNAIKAFKYVKERIGEKFPYETEAIFIKEYLYGTITTVTQKKMSNKELKKYIIKTSKLYENWYRNKSIYRQPIHVRICLKLIKHKNIFLLKLLMKIRKIFVR